MTTLRSRIEASLVSMATAVTPPTMLSGAISWTCARNARTVAAAASESGASVSVAWSITSPSTTVGSGAGVSGGPMGWIPSFVMGAVDRKSTRLNSSHVASSYAVFCVAVLAVISALSLHDALPIYALGCDFLDLRAQCAHGGRGGIGVGSIGQRGLEHYVAVHHGRFGRRRIGWPDGLDPVIRYGRGAARRFCGHNADAVDAVVL